MWNGLLALVTLILYSVAVAALVLMALFYTRAEGCMYNKVLIGVNGSLCLFVSLVAISPCVQSRESTDVFFWVSGAATVVCLEAWKTPDSSELVLLLPLSFYLHYEVLFLVISSAAKTAEVWDILGVPSGSHTVRKVHILMAGNVLCSSHNSCSGSSSGTSCQTHSRCFTIYFLTARALPPLKLGPGGVDSSISCFSIFYVCC